jgi:hypothetical protein
VDWIPWDEPAAIAEYLKRSVADSEYNPNKWLLTVQTAIAQMRRSVSPGDRRMYRDAALTAASLAGRTNGERWFTRWVELSIKVRAIYLGYGYEDREWADREAESIYDDFAAAVGLDASGMSDLLSGRQPFPSGVDPARIGRIGDALLFMGN